MEEPLTIKSPKLYRWEPEPDITAFELAMVLPAFCIDPMDAERHIESLAPQFRRHFKEGCLCHTIPEKKS